MANYVNVAVVLKTKKNFDIAWQIAEGSEKLEGQSAHIPGDYILNFYNKCEMDWGIIRKISKSVDEQVKVFTYYDGDGSAEMATYTAGKRDSKTVLNYSSVDYWRGLMLIFGTLDWCLPIGKNKELVFKSDYGYPLAKVYVVDYGYSTFERIGTFAHLSELPNVVKHYLESNKKTA